MELPLSDITILELAEAAAGPLTGMMFADMGAEVIKVEKPGIGDVLRQYEPKKDGVAAYYLWANRNKRSITLDLKTDEGRDILLDLAKDVDIFLENYSPGVVEKLGIGYDEVKAINENVIYCHVSGFGRDGPYHDRKVIDHVMQGEAGIMGITGYPDKPAKAGFVYTDITTAMYNSFLLLSAIRFREQTGKGQEIEMAMWDVQLWNLGLHGYRYLMTGEVSKRMGTKYPAIVPYQAFKTKDDEYVNVCAITQRHWEKYCKNVIERPDLFDDPRFETNQKRVENRDVLDPILDEEMLKWTSDTLMDRLIRNGVPSSPINEIDDVINHPVTEHRDLLTKADHATLGEIDLIGFPGKMSEIKQTVRQAPPIHGEHTQEILGEYGYSEEEISALRESGAVDYPD